jgi:sporulation integral membrane protein YlbJ
MAYTFLIMIFASILLLITLQPSRTLYIRLLSLPVLCIAFTICLVLFSDTAVKAAAKGLNLWAAVVVPSLFPFFIVSDLLRTSGFAYLAGALLEPVMRPLFNVPGCSSLALALGVASGYPVGARITTDLRKNNALTAAEAERLLAFTNNSGPLFIIGAVGTGMLGSSAIGLFLYICHLLACITVGLVFRFYKRTEKSSCHAKKHIWTDMKKKLSMLARKRPDPGTLLGDAVRNSVSSILAIGGFIVLFSVIISFLAETGLIRLTAAAVMHLLPKGIQHRDAEGVISGIICGALEITTGAETISRCAAVPIHVKLSALSLIIGWAGLSVHLQVKSIISETGINMRPYLLGKLLQGAAAAIYTWAGLKLVPTGSLAVRPVQSLPAFSMQSFFQTLGQSVWIPAAVIMIWICIVSVIWLQKDVKKKSST